MFYIVLCIKGTYFGTVVERGNISSNYLDTLKRNPNQFCRNNPEQGWKNEGKKVSCICTYLVKNITTIARGKTLLSRIPKQ